MPPDNSITAGPATSSWAPWRIVLLLMAICFLAHFNRVSMAVAGDLRIMKDYAITPTAMGTVYSAFLIAYTLCMIPGGWLIDRRGPRFSLSCVLFGSSAFVMLTGSVGLVASSETSALASFIAIRALMGIVSAPLHPAAAKAVSLHIPAAGRSMANGLVTGAALLGVASTYFGFGELVDRFGWPRAFMIAGAVTAVLGWVWSRYAVERADACEGHAAADAIDLHEQLASPAQSFLRRSKNLLLLTASYATVGYFQYLFFYWMHYYFETVLKLGADESRLYAAVPPLAMAVGMPLGGWLSDRFQSNYHRRAGRVWLPAAAMIASATLLILGVRATEPFWIVGWLSLSLGALGMAEGPFWVAAVEVGGRRGGLSAAIFNTGGNAGGIASPVVTPWISETLGFGWQAGIAVGSVVCLAGAVLWYWIDLDA